ncbi:MAG: sulfurtransferase TusA family protein [Sphingomonadales bacterium]
MTEQVVHRLDITALLCPMTFVRTRLLLDSMQPGEVAEIILREGEPLKNVPEAVRDLGHAVLLVEETGHRGVFRMLVRTAAPI